VIIDDHQCVALISSVTGKLREEYDTKLRVCIRRESVKFTYSACLTACHPLQRGEGMNCMRKESNELETRTCCQVIKRGPDGLMEDVADE